MDNTKQNILNTGLIVGYVIAFEDGRPDKIGLLPLLQSEPSPLGIFKQMLKIEPTIRECSYIFGNIRPDHSFFSYIDTIEFKKAEIENIIQTLVKPGIIKRP